MFYKCLASFVAMESDKRKILCKKIKELISLITQLDTAFATEGSSELVDLPKLKVELTDRLEEYREELKLL